MHIYLIGYARSEQAMTNEKRKRAGDRKYEGFLLNDYPACTGNPAPAKLFGTRKVVQLTGDTDRATGQKTMNETGKRFGIYGTDLGVSFLHDGKLYFLFGDTNRREGYPGLPASAVPGEDFNEDITDLDAIAYTTSDRAYDGIKLTFNSDFPHLDNVEQMTGEHPIEGISLGEGEYMYVFFTTDLFPEEKVPTRTVLARSNDGGIHFGNSIYTLSTDKFIHVSAQIIDNHVIQGLPEKNGEGLLIWGSSTHRKSDVYLAYMPLNQILNRSSLRFFAGISSTSDHQPLWEPDESKAKPLFSAGCVGELSVRWNYLLEKWIMLYNCELCNTSGIIVRLSDRPWGPWSAAKIVFDPSDGYGKFMHEPGKDNNYDYGRDGPKDRGDEYGPYQIAPYSTGIRGRYTKIYFTMSTWNPYQVVQMSAIITSKEEEEQEDPKPYATDIHDRNDRKYAYISILLAHLAKINEIDLRNHIQSSTYIADHIEWAQFHSTDELRAEIKDKFLQLISGLASDADKAEVYSTMIVAFSKLSYDYHNNITFKDNLDQTKHRRWALDAIHSGHNDWLISQINRAADYEYFLLSSNDCLCYAYGPQDSNEFKYARLNVLLSNLANKIGGVKGMNSHSHGSPPFDCNAYIAWARFRSVKEIRDDLLNKIRQIICKSSSDEFIAFAYDEITKVIVKLTDGDHQIPSYNEDCSDAYEWGLSMMDKRKKEEIIIRITKLIDNDYFLIPFGLITRRG